MYAKLFASIYQGTLRGNTHGLVVFTNMLAHADAAGWVDMHPKAIAEEVGLTLDQVLAAIAELEAPDAESRSPEENGRRIVLLDVHRAWGWRIVNHAKYRAIRSEEDRREQNRLAQERFRAKRNADSNESKPRKPPSAQAEAEAEAELDDPSDHLVAIDRRMATYEVPKCQIKAVVEAYHEKCPALNRVEVMNEFRRGLVRSRWREVCSAEKFDADAAVKWWEGYFSLVAKSRFLTGRTRAVNGSSPFKADFEWLVRPQNFAKVIEMKYHRETA